ncbi:2-oxo-4-hydroxy-4-carboxy-5-ureidoimidazoline decarboxylase-like [Watersipora subatra]|uniref:2-oxo-4-hydroxy-4-carboxy-5-ureidoimidazoline decarboxylase-like n=1 Tax=Watersipora subatra TaxID=2589382 RepID=UPI00355ADB97
MGTLPVDSDTSSKDHRAIFCAAMVLKTCTASACTKVGVIRSMPDLAGKLATAKLLGKESTLEQRAAGLESLSAEEKAMMDQLNSKYKEKFGFPFVICARKNVVSTIFNGMKARLERDKDLEIATALAEIQNICWLRLNDIVKDESAIQAVY